MALDRREAIISRLIAIAQTIDGVQTVARNQQQISAHLRPAIVIIDGNEEGTVGEFGLGRPLTTPRIIDMQPEIYIMLGGSRETLGAELNAMRFKIVKAVLTDGELYGLVTTTGGGQYQGCVIDLARGGTSEGQMNLNFSFHYPVRTTEM